MLCTLFHCQLSTLLEQKRGQCNDQDKCNIKGMLTNNIYLTTYAAHLKNNKQTNKKNLKMLTNSSCSSNEAYMNCIVIDTNEILTQVVMSCSLLYLHGHIVTQYRTFTARLVNVL